MRKVRLSMEAQEKYEIIKKTAEGHLSKQTASVKIGCTLRHVNRLLVKYRQHGKEAFLHGNTGRKPAHALSCQQRRDIVALYNEKYWDTNFTHCCELMEKQDGICISSSCLAGILAEEYILSPRATRLTRKRMNIRLKQLHKEATTKKQKDELHASLVAAADAHPRRSRCAYFGEMLQMDASLHLWFGETKTQLHIAVDDCTGVIVGAWFDTQETLNGYYHVFHQILSQYGIPHMFYTDNRTVFEYHNKKMKDIGKDTFTQFSYACKQFGVAIKTTSVPQAKGRVERMFGTLQSRLPVELRLKGITTLSEANTFLNSYIKEHNAKFALPINYNKSVFEMQPDMETINQTLAVLTPRVVDHGHCIKLNHKYYRTIDSRGITTYYHQGTKGLVIKTFTGELLFSTNDKLYALDEVPQHEKSSRNFDLESIKQKPQKRHLPGAKHPWRNSAFLKHVPYQIPQDQLV